VHYNTVETENDKIKLTHLRCTQRGPWLVERRLDQVWARWDHKWRRWTDGRSQTAEFPCRWPANCWRTVSGYGSTMDGRSFFWSRHAHYTHWNLKRTDGRTNWQETKRTSGTSTRGNENIDKQKRNSAVDGSLWRTRISLPSPIGV